MSVAQKNSAPNPSSPSFSTRTAVRIEGVNKRFGSVQAVRDISLQIPERSLCGFLGPNGAGKSTTIRMIMSIISPDSGTVEVLGSSALRMKDRIGYLPEERGLYRKMKVGEFVGYMAKLKGVHPTGLTRRIEDWLERLALPGVAKRRCEELSKGQQQKIQLLSAIIHAPDLLILDEPFSGLDPINGRLVTDLIRSEQARGATIIFSTHQMHTAEALCDKVVLINKATKFSTQRSPSCAPSTTIAGWCANHGEMPTNLLRKCCAAASPVLRAPMKTERSTSISPSAMTLRARCARYLRSLRCARWRCGG